MSFTYKWEVTGLKVKDQLNADSVILANSVCQTYWKVTGTDVDGNEGSFSGATQFNSDNCSIEDFVAFESLSEVQVLSWIQNIVDNDASYKTHIDSQIQKRIDAVAITEAIMPWAPVENSDIISE
jgi:hypothetical protein